MFCNECGNEYKEEDKFCNKCGNNLTENKSVPKEEPVINQYETVIKDNILNDDFNFYNWVSGIIFIFTAICFLVNLKIICGFIFLIISTILIPPLQKFIENKYKINISSNLKIAIIIIGFILVGFNLNLNEKNETYKKAETALNKKDLKVLAKEKSTKLIEKQRKIKDESILKSKYRITNYIFNETDYFGKDYTWKLVLVKGNPNKEELYKIAKKLHTDNPETCFELFSTLQTIKNQYLFRTQNIDFPEKYYDRDWKGTINSIYDADSFKGGTQSAKWTYSSYEGSNELE